MPTVDSAKQIAAACEYLRCVDICFSTAYYLLFFIFLFHLLLFFLLPIARKFRAFDLLFPLSFSTISMPRHSDVNRVYCSQPASLWRCDSITRGEFWSSLFHPLFVSVFIYFLSCLYVFFVFLRLFFSFHLQSRITTAVK